MSGRVPRARRLVAVGSGVLVLCLGASACGGDPESVDPAPQSESPRPTASVTPTPTITPSAAPLSRFENEPTVKVARLFAAAAGKSINDDEPTLQAAFPFLTMHGREVLPGQAAEDMKLYYPGPLPFTPTSVDVQGPESAIVRVCLWVSGWGQSPATKLPAEKRRVEPGKFIMKKQSGSWRVHDLQDDGGNCSNVPVKGVAW